MPVVSVVMPAYNAAPYIESAITSALRQTFADLEILVVDDGSADDTAAIVARVAARDPRVRLLRQPNRGVSAARNAALREARGQYFALFDSDDLWEPEFLAAQMTILEERSDVDIVTGNGWYLGGAKHGQPARPYPDHRPAPDLASIIGDETSVFIMSVVRRRVYTTIGQFDENLRTNEDYDYWLRAAIAACTFTRNDRPLGHYRIHTASLSATDVRMLRGILRVYAKLRPFIAERPRELAILDAQVSRFETERLAAEARLALQLADFEAAREHLAALHARRGGAALGVATLLARWSPKTLVRVMRFRHANLSAVPAGPPVLPERP